MPVLAASDTIATWQAPAMKRLASATFLLPSAAAPPPLPLPLLLFSPAAAVAEEPGAAVAAGAGLAVRRTRA